jgi:SAM-dependent methyltransferase
MDDTRSKQVKLYQRVDRVFNELKAIGMGDDDPIPVEQLCNYDQYHYFGTDAIDEAIELLGITADSQVLEIGSGIGGPSRYLAHRQGCKVTALEIQPDVDATGRTLTHRCGLDDRVDHRCGDNSRCGCVDRRCPQLELNSRGGCYTHRGRQFGGRGRGSGRPSAVPFSQQKCVQCHKPLSAHTDGKWCSGPQALQPLHTSANGDGTLPPASAVRRSGPPRPWAAHSLPRTQPVGRLGHRPV